MQQLTKEEARAIVRKRLLAMTDIDRIQQSKNVIDQILNSNILYGAKSILLYAAMDAEVNVERLINECIQRDIKVYFPRVNGGDIQLVLYGDGQFAVGAYGILEPIGEAVHVEIDIAIIPLLAIDNSLCRLGKGKGYYDRFLVGFRGKKVGVAYEQQLLDNLPKDSYDISMDICFINNAVIGDLKRLICE